MTFLKTLLRKAFPFLKAHLKVEQTKLEAEQKFTSMIQNAVEDKKCSNFLTQLKTFEENINDVSMASLPFISHGLEALSIAFSHALYEVSRLKISC
jgi:hypothetical protein